MKIYGKDIDFRITRVEDAEKFKDALKKMQNDEAKLQKMKNSDLASFLKEYIEMFRKFFTNATGQNVLEECSDAQEAHDAYIEFLREIKKTKSTIMNFSIEDIQ